MDAAWLKETIGPVLVKSLAVTVAAEPADPVDYLANVLLKCGGRAPAGGGRPLTPTPGGLTCARAATERAGSSEIEAHCSRRGLRGPVAAATAGSHFRSLAPAAPGLWLRTRTLGTSWRSNRLMRRSPLPKRRAFISAANKIHKYPRLWDLTAARALAVPVSSSAPCHVKKRSGRAAVAPHIGAKRQGGQGCAGYCS